MKQSYNLPQCRIIGSPELVFLKLDGTLWGWWETVTLKVLAYVQSTLWFHFGGCHCRKPCFTKMGCWKLKQAFQCFCSNLTIFCLTLIQNLWRFEVVSSILSRPQSFAILSSWSSFSTAQIDLPGLFTNGSRIHSFQVQGSFMVGK